jgi:hypothetical protein
LLDNNWQYHESGYSKLSWITFLFFFYCEQLQKWGTFLPFMISHWQLVVEHVVC